MRQQAAPRTERDALAPASPEGDLKPHPTARPWTGAFDQLYFLFEKSHDS